MTDLMMVSISRGLMEHEGSEATKRGVSSDKTKARERKRKGKKEERRGLGWNEPDGPEVDDLNVDTLLSKVLGSLETVSNHLGVSDDGDVGSLSLDLRREQKGRRNGQLSVMSFEFHFERTLAFPMGLRNESIESQLELKEVEEKRRYSQNELRYRRTGRNEGQLGGGLNGRRGKGIELTSSFMAASDIGKEIPYISSFSRKTTGLGSRIAA